MHIFIHVPAQLPQEYTSSTSSSAAAFLSFFPAQLTPLSSLTSFPSRCCPRLRPRASPTPTAQRMWGNSRWGKVAQPWRFTAPSRSLFHTEQPKWSEGVACNFFLLHWKSLEEMSVRWVCNLGLVCVRNTTSVHQKKKVHFSHSRWLCKVIF